MKRADRKRWAAATSLLELGDLVALWLEGAVASQPGYQPNCGPDNETVPLVATLAAANRSGFVTHSSQPGYDGLGYDQARWAQRAAVGGFVDLAGCAVLELLVANVPGLHVIAQTAGRTRVSYDLAEAVTCREGEERTWFGARLPRRHIADLYEECNPRMHQVLFRAVQVTVVDLQWGRETALWPVLDAFAAEVRS